MVSGCSEKIGPGHLRTHGRESEFEDLKPQVEDLVMDSNFFSYFPHTIIYCAQIEEGSK